MNGHVTPDYLDQLQALCDPATPGPWYAADQDASDYNGHTLAGDDDEQKTTVTTDPKKEGWRVDGGFGDYMITVRDAKFIAAARDAVPKLIAEVRRLQTEDKIQRKEIRRLRQEMRTHALAMENVARVYTLPQHDTCQEIEDLVECLEDKAASLRKWCKPPPHIGDK